MVGTENLMEIASKVVDYRKALDALRTARLELKAAREALGVAQAKEEAARQEASCLFDDVARLARGSIDVTVEHW